MKYNESDQEAWDRFAAAAFGKVLGFYLSATERWAKKDIEKWAVEDAADYADAMMAERAKRMEGTR